MKRASIAFLYLVLLSIACGSEGTTDRRATLVSQMYPSPTSEATQTPVLLTVISTKVVQITVTPEPTPEPTDTPRQIKLCVIAVEAVYLRPSPSVAGYPILQLPNGAEVESLGGRDKNWLYVQYREKAGWVNDKYIGVCDE